MRKLLLLFSCVLLAGITLGQEAEKKSSKGKWDRGLSIGLHVGQGGSRNWAIGAEKFSLWVTGKVNAYANKIATNWLYWDNEIQLNYGIVNTHTTGVRKVDDKIDISTKPGYKIKEKMGAAILINFRSQFYDGNNYNYLNQDLKRKISSFMAPGYLTITPGLDFKCSKSFSIVVSPVASKFTFVTNEPYSYSFQGGLIPPQNQTEGSGAYEKPLAINYGVDPEREVRVELGTGVTINFNKEVMKNVSWKSKLDLFSSYSKRTEFFGPNYASSVKADKAHPEKVDVYFTNSIVMKVNKWLNVAYDFDIIYDDDVRMFGPNADVAAMQLRSMLGVGVGIVAKF